MAGVQGDGVFLRPVAQAFLGSSSLPVDIAVMERTDRACVVPVEMGWSDIGSWDALWAVSEHDGEGNSLCGDVVAIESAGTLIRNESGLTIAAVGLQDMVVIATATSILILPRDQAQKAGLAAAAVAAHRSTQIQD
jgi:mannose-1-phosphate guanylyltransferase